MTKAVKVLVVDDDKNILKSAKMYLKKYDISLASSGKEALELIKKNDFDVIISDYNMPELNGLELVGALNKKNSITPIIVMSGQLNVKISLDFANLHVYHIVEKPFLFEDLFSKIDSAYEEKENFVQTQKLSIIGRESGHIIHDLNNSLAIIEGSSDIGLSHTTENFLMRQFERTIKACNNIKNMVSTYKTFLNSSDSINFTNTNLSSLAEDFVLECKLVHPNIKFTFEKNTKNDLYSLVNENILNQVLLNLVANSLDSIKDMKNPWIKVIVESSRTKNVIKIIDSGKVPDRDVQAKLFKQKVSTKGAKGTGMGLMYCKELCEKMYGSICFEASEINTCFKLEFVSNILETDKE